MIPAQVPAQAQLQMRPNFFSKIWAVVQKFLSHKSSRDGDIWIRYG
jgi:hypothetical protein